MEKLTRIAIYGDFQQILDNLCLKNSQNGSKEAVLFDQFRYCLKKIDEKAEQLGDKIVCKHAYLKSEKYPQESTFVEYLKESGYQISFGPMPKKDTDTTMCSDILGEIRRYDIALICSGDADFAPPIIIVQKRGKRVYQVVNQKANSPKLLEIIPKSQIFIIDNCEKCQGTGRYIHPDFHVDRGEGYNCEGVGLAEYHYR
jgi:uncharacterized LabA/DUF88 family protein